MRLHQDAQRLLRPIAVVNSYAPRLTFLDTRTRTWRDHEKYLTLIPRPGGCSAMLDAWVSSSTWSCIGPEGGVIGAGTSARSGRTNPLRSASGVPPLNQTLCFEGRTEVA